MAKVKITGHASGTGVVTVTAPNTSTDRTITLPDSTDTLAVNSDVTNKLPLAGGILTGDLDISDTGAGALTVGGTTNTYSAPVLFNVTDLGLDITDGTKHLASWASHGGSSHTGSAIGTRSNHNLALTTNDTHRVFIDTTGAVTMPAQPAFFAYRNTTNSLSSENPLVFSVEDLDVGGNYNTSNNRFTAPVAGKYMINIQMSFYKDGDCRAIETYLRKNGGDIYRNDTWIQQTAGNNTHTSGSLNVLINLAANDYLDVRFTATSAVNVFSSARNSFFSGYLVG